MQSRALRLVLLPLTALPIATLLLLALPLAGALREVGAMSAVQIVLISLSGRGDKDIFTIADALEDENWNRFLRDKVAVL